MLLLARGRLAARADQIENPCGSQWCLVPECLMVTEIWRDEFECFSCRI